MDDDDNNSNIVTEEVVDDAPKRDSKARTASAAVFFNENKSIAGFGNSMRAVFTSVRELVENSLDASEKRGVTPEIKVKLRRLEKKELIELMGTNVIKTKDKRVDFIELSCRDNGVGVSRDLIPQLFGTVLAGTKYGAQQTRGRFGLGSKMVLLYAMSTLDLPIQITTRPEGEEVTYRVQLFINLEKNAPIIHQDVRFEPGDEEYFNDYGTEIKVSFTGSWNLAKLYVREYFRQLAIITPYADMLVDLPAEDDETGHYFFQRVVDEIPKPPEVVRVHPWGTDISTFRREMNSATEDNLVDFLVNNFMGVDENAAIAFFEEVGVETDKKPQDLTSQEIRRIVHDGFNRALKESKTVKRKRFRIFKFNEPKGDALSPLGADRLRKGLEKELAPEFVEAITRSPKAYEGHPFIIEAAIGYGGGVNAAAQSKGVTIVDNRVIYRFANRIPLIFGAGSDLITNVANSINWSNYGLTRGTEPLAIAVSLVSTKIPFPETSKEYIDKVEEIGSEVRLTLLQLGKKLKTFLGRRRRRQRERRRKSRFERYAPRTVWNLLEILRKEQLWDPSTGVSPDRIISALASGNPRIDSQSLPIREHLYQAPMWALPQTQELLQENGIFEVASFLRTSNEKLASILSLDEDQVDLIKRRTIAELDKAEQTPDLETEVILSSDDEIRFHRRDEKEKLIELPRLYKACNRRWIRNAYDYLVSTSRQLHKVQGLSIKLVEAERAKVIHSLFEEVEDVDLADELSTLLDEGGLLGDFEGEIDKFTQDELPSDIMSEVEDDGQEVAETPKKEDNKLNITISELFPPLEEIYEHEKLKSRKVNSILEFLLETTHPSSPIDEKVLASVLIPHFQKSLKALVEQNKEYGEIKVSVSSQDWIDGYLRNAFKRRNIHTVNDVIKADLSQLQEIGELQRTLFYGLKDGLIPEKGEIDPSDFKVEHAMEKIMLLEAAGITSLERFAATTSDTIAGDPNLIPYVDMILEESKDKIVDYLTMNNLLGPLTLLKEISPELEEEMDRLELTDSMEFLITPLAEFDKQFHDRITHAKKAIGTGFECLYKKHQSTLNSIGSVVLEEIVYNSNWFLSQKIDESAREELIEIIEYLQEPPILISPNLIPSMDILNDAGVNTVGKFLIWPTERLAQIIDMPDEWINLLRDSFHVKDIKTARKEYLPPLEKVSHILNPTEIEHIKMLGVDSVIQATSLKWGDYYPSYDGVWSKISNASEILMTETFKIIDDVSSKKDSKNLSSAFEDLQKEGIVTLLQLIRVPISSLTQKLSTKSKRAVVEQLSIDFRSQEPELISKESNYYQIALAYFAIEKLRSPIASLSGFNIREIGLLSEDGIRSIHQLIAYPNAELTSVLGISEDEIQKKIENSNFNPKGTPIARSDERGNLHSIIEFVREGNNYFQQEEINSLGNSGYNTIEALYYMSDHRTFDVQGVSWEIIRHFKKLMESPPVLITWKKVIQEQREVKKEKGPDESLLFQDPTDKVEDKPSEVEYETVEVEYYETFSSHELEILTKENIRRVMDFLTAPTELISELMGWPLEMAKERQTSVLLQEAGIELSDLEIFRDDHVTHLKEMGLITIEDLYFTAKEETWESLVIPWNAINTVKKILHLPLHHVIPEVGEDIHDLLTENGISTILEFILTGDPILEQTTGLPAERFENLKYALDFGSLIEAFDKTVMFAPTLTFDQCKTLRENGVDLILDLVLSDPKDIAKILGIDDKEVTLICEQISRETIQRCESERGVQLRDVNAFSRSDIRSISRSGIFEMNMMDTIQEILYQVNKENFQGENYLAEMVVNLQKVCNLELNKIGDLNENDVRILENVGVETISDAILVNYDDLGQISPDLDRALSNVTKSVLDMQSFIAMGKLPAQSAMVEGENPVNLLTEWLDHPEILHQRTMRNIRSILSLPLRLTSLSKLLTEAEDVGNMTLSEIVMEYIPNEEDELFQVQQSLKETGALVRLLREGSTPLTLLELSPSEFRALVKAGINTVERIIMNDAKTLSNLSGGTQKYWREIKEVFDPEMFNARLGDIGIPINVVLLEKEDAEYLSSFGISYLDQISIYDEPKGIIAELQDFLYAPTIFLAGTPGEREMAENADARSILEAAIALKRGGATAEIVNEMIGLAWQAYSKYLFETPSRSSNNSVETIQDLCQTYLYEPEVLTKRQVEYAQLYVHSPLLLPLPRDELENIVIENRCVTIIDALSNPMVAGKIDEIREKILNGEDPEVMIEVELPNILLSEISKTVWKRIEKSNLSLQEVLSSPRSLEVYRETKQKYLAEARQALRLPLSQIHIGGNQMLMNIGEPNRYFRLEDLIFDLPELYRSDNQVVNRVTEFLGSSDLEVLSDLAIPESIIKAAETAFGTPVEGFHDLWVSTWNAHHLLQKIDTQPADKLKQYIFNAFSPVHHIIGIKPVEIWQLWRIGIITISDLLLAPRDDLGSTDYFTKKRVGELKKAALSSLENEFKEAKLSIKTIAEYLGEDLKRDVNVEVMLLSHENPHPIVLDILQEVETTYKKTLNLPLMDTKFGQQLSIVDQDQIYSCGIYSVIDWIVYPKEMKLLPEEFQNLDSRLERLKDQLEVVDGLQVNDFNLPDVAKSVVSGESPVSKLLSKVILRGDRKLVKSISVPLSYANLDEEMSSLLEETGLSTSYDLLHYSPSSLAEKLGITIKEAKSLLTGIDFAAMFEELENAPLQVSSIESISKGGREILRDADIYTALDLYTPLPEGLNRIDTSYLTTLTQVLESDLSYLQVLPSLDSSVTELSNKYTNVRSLYYSIGSLEESIRKEISALSVDDLINLQSRHRQFHDIEELIIKEEKILISGGIFTFHQLGHQSVETLIGLGFSEDKATDLLEMLNSHWRNIVDLPTEVEQKAEELEITSIEQLLQSPEIMKLEIKTPIKIKKELKLKQILNSIPSIVSEANVQTVSDLIRSQELINEFEEGNKEVVDLIAKLNSWIGYLPGINEKWVPKLEDAKIYRIWQVIVEDTNALSDICGTSIKAQETFKASLSLDGFAKPDFTIPTLYKKDRKLFEDYGFTSLKEVLQGGILESYFGTVEELNEKIEQYRQALKQPISVLNAYWDMDALERRRLAKLAESLEDLAQVDVDAANVLIADAVKENYREAHPLDTWLTDSKELESLKNRGITSVEDWMFYNTRGEIEPGSSSFLLFRSTLDVLPYFTIKHLVSGYHSGITHISDLLLEDNKELAKKLRTTSKKVDELLATIPELKEERPELPNLGLVNSSIVEAMREGGIFSWAQIIGNAVKEEIELIKGVTWNTVGSVREHSNIPMWHSLEIRALGIDNLRKLVKEGVSTIADILVIGDKFREFVGDDKLYHSIMDNISRANLRKGAQQISLRLSESYKIRVKDIPEYEKAGILSPMDILIGNYDVPKNSPLTDGIDDWHRIGSLDVAEINFPMKVIKELKKRGITKVEDAILTPDTELRDAGATNHQVRAFRKDLNRLKKGEKRVS